MFLAKFEKLKMTMHCTKCFATHSFRQQSFSFNVYYFNDHKNLAFTNRLPLASFKLHTKLLVKISTELGWGMVDICVGKLPATSNKWQKT